MSDSATIVQKLWNYCHVLRDDGLSYQDYIEQLTFLLFLKMAHEQTQPPFSRPAIVRKGLDWPSLERRDGDELDLHYRHILAELGRQPGTLGVIFRKAQNKIQDPAKLKRLVSDLIGREQWMTLDADVKGDAYEGLLAKNAEDVKSGAGQYFTPRPLVKAIVDVMRPTASMRVCDPAAGTGGFLLAAHERMKSAALDPDVKRFLRDQALRGWEIVDATARLCAMNLLLHGIGLPELRTRITGRPVVVVADPRQLTAHRKRLKAFLTEQRPVLVGVDAATSATRSSNGESGSCPMALTTGGRPGGATGRAEAVESARQLRGEAVKRQGVGARRGLTHTLGGTGATAIVHLFERGD